MKKIKIPSEDVTDYIVDTRLYFENGRLYVSRIPYKGSKQVDFSEKIDVTDEVLEMLLKAYDKKVSEAKQAAIIEQLKL